MYLEGSHYRSLKLGSAALCLSKPGSDWCNRTHFQMRIFLVFGCHDDDLKMVKKMAVLHLQIAKVSASGGGKRPPAAPAAGIGGSFASGAHKSDRPDRQKVAKSEPNSRISGALDAEKTRKAQIPTPLAEVHDGWAHSRVRGATASGIFSIRA